MLSLCGRQAITWDCFKSCQTHITDFIADGAQGYGGLGAWGFQAWVRRCEALFLMRHGGSPPPSRPGRPPLSTRFKKPTLPSLCRVAHLLHRVHGRAARPRVRGARRCRTVRPPQPHRHVRHDAAPAGAAPRQQLPLQVGPISCSGHPAPADTCRHTSRAGMLYPLQAAHLADSRLLLLLPSFPPPGTAPRCAPRSTVCPWRSSAPPTPPCTCWRARTRARDAWTSRRTAGCWWVPWTQGKLRDGQPCAWVALPCRGVPVAT